MNFQVFKSAVAEQFGMMSKHQLFRTEATKDGMWETYLNGFPSGSNPVFKTRTEHDCNCCKQFIRAVGDVVAIIDGKLVSIWDIRKISEPNYQAVAAAMSTFVKSKPISNVFLHYEPKAGTDKSYDQTVGKEVHVWDHCFVNIPKQFVVHKDQIDTKLGETKSTYDVFIRGLNTVATDSVETVLELIDQNSIYRGQEHRATVLGFSGVQREFERCTSEIQQSILVWSKIKETPFAVSKIRNSVIGTLLTDLSEGKSLEDSVASFEVKVAPTNYKRTSSLVTKTMKDNAKKAVKELGLTSALSRRYATINDITVNNVLFANRSARKAMHNSVFDDALDKLAVKSTSTKSLDKVEEIHIEKFLSDVVPKATSLEIMFDNKHAGNLVSLVAPLDATANRLFKWDNGFSWSYEGELADSIKERVKKAGGNVSGDLCCRLAWSNYDDLDFHMQEPGGYEIYFSNRNQTSPCGGRLDVDMNARSRESRSPVENIFYGSQHNMREGVYTLFVHNFNKREMIYVGFEVEIDFMGTVHRFNYANHVNDKEEIVVAKFMYTKANGIKFIESLPSSVSSKVVWGIATQKFHRVNVLMKSPNYWDGQGVGNKHYFFMLEDCLNSGVARGFFNEFLRPELTPHRKVIDMVGSVMSTAESNKQLSGLGFSSTMKNDVLCRVEGSFSRILKIVF